MVSTQDDAPAISIIASPDARPMELKESTMTMTRQSSVIATDAETITMPVKAGKGSRRQSFLVGEEVYLRTFRVGDHKYATSWRHSIFPKSSALVKQWIREDLPKEGKNQRGHLAIVRKADDVIVGSAICEYDDVGCWMSLHVDPLYGDTGLRWKAEALRLLAEWNVDEKHNPVAHVEVPATETIVIEAAQAFGMRESARFREMFLIDGQRVDKVVFEYLNKGWVQTLGDPRDIPLERAGSGQPRPVPPKVTLDGDPPKNAMLVGERIYLRPEEKEDAGKIAEWARKETESFWDIGRHLVSSVVQASWSDDHQEGDKPSWVWFAVCLRENDEPIGAVGLIDVDYVNLFAETGSYFHRPDYRGSGYGSEAKQLLLEYGFNVLGLHMVQSWVYFPNTRSAAALRKQGYKEAGQINWLYSHKGRFDNFVVFDMLADEWRAMPRKELEL